MHCGRACLIVCIKSMENKLFTKIYKLYYKPLYLYALSLTHHMQEAEDLTEETFLKAFLTLDSHENIQAWLFLVLKNLFYMKVRKRKRMLDMDAEKIKNIPDPSYFYKEKQEQRLWLYEKIFSMEPLEKNIILLTVTAGLKDEEIAKIVNTSVQNVRVIRYRTKEKLKELAKKEGYIDE